MAPVQTSGMIDAGSWVEVKRPQVYVAVMTTSASIMAVLLIVPLMVIRSPAGTASKVSVRRTGLPDFIASPGRCRIAEYLTIPAHDHHATVSNCPARGLPAGRLDSIVA